MFDKPLERGQTHTCPSALLNAEILVFQPLTDFPTKYRINLLSYFMDGQTIGVNMIYNMLCAYTVLQLTHELLSISVIY